MRYRIAVIAALAIVATLPGCSFLLSAEDRIAERAVDVIDGYCGAADADQAAILMRVDAATAPHMIRLVDRETYIETGELVLDECSGDDGR
jgi:outer membrane lipopolysaccharide assembly protein LptE/RlpB